VSNFGSEILLNQLKAAHGALEQTMEGVTDEVAHSMPPGTANPIAGVYAHLVFSEDLFIHSFLKETPPLLETKFKGKTGASEVHPTDWKVEYPRWLKEVHLDIKQFQKYTKAVFEESEKYVASLKDEDLKKDVDMSAWGMGTKKEYDFIANLISGHIYPTMGEISVLKGIQGLKGYPF
jgi:hypothetical protein